MTMYLGPILRFLSLSGVFITISSITMEASVTSLMLYDGDSFTNSKTSRYYEHNFSRPLTLVFNQTENLTAIKKPLQWVRLHSSHVAIRSVGTVASLPLGTLAWNTTRTTAEEFHQLVCLSQQCPPPCGSRWLDRQYLSVICFDCDCQPSCHRYGTCCSPTLADSSPENSEAGVTFLKDAAGCAEAYSAFIRCPYGWQRNQTIRQACENGRGVYSPDEPVSDSTTDLVYRNAACAMCHGVLDYVTWPLNVSCQHYQYVYKAVSVRELLLLAGESTDACTFTHTPPADSTIVPAAACRLSENTKQQPFCIKPEWFSQPPIRACNVSGQWSAYDWRVERACLTLTLTAPAYRVFDPRADSFYANLFCGLCNGVVLRKTALQPSCCEVPTSSPKERHSAPFSFLFGLSDSLWQEVADVIRCQQGSLLLPNNQCRNLTCTAGKTLVNGTCITAVSMIAGLAYRVDATFVLTPPVRGNNSFYLYPLQEEIVESLKNSTLDINLKIFEEKTLVVFSPNLTSNNTILTILETGKLRIIGDITASRSLGRDSAEQRLVNVFFKLGWNITVDNTEVLVQPLSVYNITQKIPAVNKNLALRLIYPIPQSWDAIYFNTELTVFLSPILVCPYLIFNKSEFALQTAEKNGLPDQVILIYGKENVTLPQDDETLLTWMDKDVLYVCQEALNKLARAVPGEVWPWQTVLSLIVLPTSLLCIVLTLFVYSLLPALRTLPGLNVMGTCLALFLAQLSLLLASQRALSGLGPWCLALGMLVHAAWLSFFSWTWLCSLHMYRAFSANTFRPSAPRLALRLARNLAFTLLLPALVVALVVTVSYVTSEGRRMGYSDERCYLDSALLVGLSVILPVAVLVTINIVLFLLTARRIHLVSKLSPHSDKDRESQHHVYVCLRLSVLTGATWVLSLIAETLDVDWLQSVSIVANGGQGVLLFLSYVVSRRVAAMLAVRLGLKEETSIHTTSTAAHSKPSAGHATSRSGLKKSH